MLEVCFIDNCSDIDIYQKHKNILADAVASGIATGFGIEHQSDVNNANFIEAPESAKEATNCCSQHNTLPNRPQPLDEKKICFCTLLRNVVKFFTKEH